MKHTIALIALLLPSAGITRSAETEDIVPNRAVTYKSVDGIESSKRTTS